MYNPDISVTFKRKTVKQVISTANSVLAGAPITVFGLPSEGGVDTLINIVRQINANYEFQGMGIMVDNGDLKPCKPLGNMLPAHQFVMP